MKKQKNEKISVLRKKAETQLKKQDKTVKNLSGQSVRDLAHELGTHQIELEMQNEELLRKQGELEASRNRFAELYDFAPLGYVTLDKNGLILEVNLTGAQLLGVERRFLINKPFSPFVHKDDRDAFHLHYAAVLKKSTKQTLTIRIFRKDKTVFYAQLDSVAGEEGKGRASTIHMTISDITERKWMEDTHTFLAQSGYNASGEDFFQALARYLAVSLRMDYVCIDRLQGDLLAAETVAVYFDGKFEDNVSYTLKDTPCGDVVGRMICSFPRNVRNLFPRDVVLQEMLAESYVGTTLWSSEGKPIGLIAIIGRKPLADPRAVTSILQLVSLRAAGELERRQAEEALKESEHRYHSLFDNMTEGFAYCKMLYDGNGQPMDFVYLEVNSSFGRLTGLLDVVGKKVTEVIPGIREADPELFRIYGRVAKTCKPERLEFYVEALKMWFSLSVYCPQIEYFVAVFDVITERKKSEQEILKLSEDMAARNLELESLNKELEAFNYSISHDLRAPLRSMSGFSKVMMEDYAGKLDDTGKDYLSRIRNGSDKMTRLVDDLLRLSKISRQEIDRMDIDLSKLAESAAHNLREASPGRNVEVVIHEGIRASADPSLMRVVMTNLLDNAWKFTGKMENARVEFGFLEKDGKTIYFVRDNGAGFDQKYANKMFWPFHRLHGDKEFAGTGIGLAIVDRIVRRHGGKVWAEGEVGKGATVFFALG